MTVGSRTAALLCVAAMVASVHAQPVVIERMADVCPGPCDGFRADSGTYAIGTTRVYFVARDPASGPRPWVTDGTAAGTLPLAQIRSDEDPGIVSMVAVGDVLFFSARTPASGEWTEMRRLWRSDGTPAGTAPVDFPVPPPKAVAPLDYRVYATSRGVVMPTYDAGIWWIPASGTSPRKLADGILQGSGPVESGGAVYFVATSCYATCPAGAQASVYRFDAAGVVTTIGTVTASVRDGYPFTEIASAPTGIFLQPALQELWYSDGAAAPRLVKRWPETALIFIARASAVKSKFVFTVSDGDYNVALWTSDGTAQGTGPLTFFSDLFYHDGPVVLGVAHGETVVAIPSNIPPSGFPDAPVYPMYSELGVLDSSAPLGVRMIRSLSPPGDRASPSSPIAVGNRMMFGARGPSRSSAYTDDHYLWLTDGTPGGTQALDNAVFADVLPLRLVGFASGAVYFQGWQKESGYELYRMTLPAGVPPAYPTVDVTEYYHAGLDHYFITADPAEKAKLDSGATAGWKRTGFGFTAYAPGAGAARTSPVCRFYGRPEAGLDSHFYSASPQECAEVVARFSYAWIEEATDVFEVELPDPSTGLCGSSLAPLYRAYDRRTDVNHRYSVHSTDQKAMVAKGWQPEGATSAGVTMCVLATLRP